MSYTAMLGVIQYAKDDTPLDRASHHEWTSHCAYFEGFAAGMNEANALSSDELDTVLGAISALRKSANPPEEPTVTPFHETIEMVDKFYHLSQKECVEYLVKNFGMDKDHAASEAYNRKCPTCKRGKGGMKARKK